MPITTSEIQAFIFSGAVANYAALPAPASVPNSYWWVQASQGTKWLPGPLGGTYYPAGTYHSNGASWEYKETPYQATQADVNAGIITDQFVSPNTFVNASKWATKENTANKNASGGYAGLSNNFSLLLLNAAGTVLNALESLGTTSRTYTFQDRDGVIADDTDLALKENAADKNDNNGYPGLNGFDIIIQKDLGGGTIIPSKLKSGGTLPRDWTFQDKDGTIADLADVALKLNSNDVSVTNSRFWITVPGTPVRVGNTSFTVTDTANANLYNLLLGRTTILKWTDSGATKQAMIVSATYAADAVTVTIIGDTLSVTATMSTFKYSVEKCKPIVFAIAGTLAVGTDLTGKYKAVAPMKVFGSDALHGTAGTTNATTYDINKNGSTMFGTKVSIASAATVGNGFTADDGTTLALDDVITVDCDSVSTIAPIDAYIYLFMAPLYNQYLN